MEDRNDYLKRTKSTLYKKGFQCMFLSVLMLLFMFFFFMDGQEGVVNMPENIFWFMQKLFTISFVIGAVSYLVSLTIKPEEEDEH